VVKTTTQLIDASTQELLNANTDDDVFMRKLHHESIFIDTTKLTHKMRNRVDRLLAVFNQNYITDNRYALDIPLDDLTIADTDLIVVNRLNYALLDKQLRHELSVQAEYQMVINNEEEKIKHNKTIEIAKKMKNRNTPIEYIMEDTGLSKEQIENL